MRNFFLFRVVPISSWPWSRYPGFCNGYVYAIKPRIAKSLVLASRTTPILTLDDIFVTGVLRDRLDQPRVGLKLINSFNLGTTSFFEWVTHCPVLGVGYYALLQDIAYQRGYWPWGMFKELGCIVLEEYLGFYTCDAK